MSDTVELIITSEDIERFKRLDQFLAAQDLDLSRTVIKNLFQQHMIQSDSVKLELKRMPTAGTKITIQIPAPKECSIEPENIPLDILFEDEHLIIVNKAAGMVVHPAPGHYQGTLVNAILYHCDDLTGVGDEKRPGIVHRLDKGTSGVMVVAKNASCHRGLIELFSTHDIEREYLAIAMASRLAVGGTIDAPIGRHPSHRIKMAANVENGKRAKTFYRVLKSFDQCHYVSCKLETGRTHQIRVHLSQCLNAPILNDSLYGKPKEHLNKLSTNVESLIHDHDYQYPFLHAQTLGFIHPITKKELIFKQDPPLMFQQVLDLLSHDRK